MAAQTQQKPRSNEAGEAPTPAKRHRPTRALTRSPISSAMRMMDLQDVMDFTRLSEKTIERMLKDDEFPRPFEVRQDAGRPLRRWTLAQIEQWVRRRSETAA